MPLHGDQHKDTHATTNPFADHRPHINDYTAKEIATLQSRLDRQLGPEYISTRPGAGGGKVHYLAAEKVINLANEVLGFNGWSSSIQNVQIDFVDEHPQSGKITLGLSTIVRVTLRDGTFHEDIGYGNIENCKGKAAAFEKAKKEAATDALKRALRNFGNVLGNCLYDKDYLQRITKLKVAPSKWDSDNLHRHPDYAPLHKESIADADAQHEKAVIARRQSSVQSGASFASAEFEDDFGGNMLDETDFTHPDEVRLDEILAKGVETPAQRAINGPQQGGQRPGVPRMNSVPQLRPPNLPQPPGPQQLSRPPQPSNLQRPVTSAGHAQVSRMLPPQVHSPVHRTPQHNGQPPPPLHTRPDAANVRSNSSSGSTLTDPVEDRGQLAQTVDGRPIDEQMLPVPISIPPGQPEGFVSGRGATVLYQPPDQRPQNAEIPKFNPHAESPSIRRTMGVNPGTSAPVRRTAIITSGANNSPAPAPLPPQGGSGNGMNGAITPIRTNFVNPQADMGRRVGMPPALGGAALHNRGSYRPPTIMNGVKRPALADVSNTHLADGASDPKKAKLEQPAPAGPVRPLGAQDGEGEGALAATTT